MRWIIACLCATQLLAQPAAPKGRKVAFLVGVGDYKHEGRANQLGELPVNDVTAIRKVLEAGGYTVVLFTDAHANHKEVLAAYSRVLNGQTKPDDKVNALGYHDTLVVHLCGHGIQVEATDPTDPAKRKVMQPFFRVHDSKPDDTDTMIPLNRLIREAAATKVRAMFLVDACRVNTDPNLRGRSGITAGKVELPEGISILYSCGANQVAQQDAKLGHGLFTYAVLKTLRGDTGRVGDVSWDELVADVKKAFKSDAEILKSLNAKPQSPTSPQGDNEYSLLLTIPKSIGGKSVSEKLAIEEPGLLAAPFTSQEIADSRAKYATARGLPRQRETKNGHVLPLIVPGTFRLGSEESHEDIVKVFPLEKAKTFVKEYPPQKTTIMKPFYMGRTEVTVAQFRAFVRATDYRTEQERRLATENKTGAKGTGDDTSWSNPGHDDWSENHPVTHVTANDAKEYCKWLSGVEGRTFRLPTSAEWEYACRAGTVTRYWVGDNPELLATIANVPDGSRRRLEQAELNRDPQKGPDVTASAIVWVFAGPDDNKTDVWLPFYWQADTRFDFTFQGQQPRVTRSAANAPATVPISNRHGSYSLYIATTDPSTDPNATTQEIKAGQSVNVKPVMIKQSLAITADDGFPGLAPVGQFKANPFGLFDMHGNVWEITENPDAVNEDDRWFNRGGCFL